jgi:hypothetical protein
MKNRPLILTLVCLGLAALVWYDNQPGQKPDHRATVPAASGKPDKAATGVAERAAGAEKARPANDGKEQGQGHADEQTARLAPPMPPGLAPPTLPGLASPTRPGLTSPTPLSLASPTPLSLASPMLPGLASPTPSSLARPRRPPRPRHHKAETRSRLSTSPLSRTGWSGRGLRRAASGLRPPQRYKVRRPRWPARKRRLRFTT